MEPVTTGVTAQVAQTSVNVHIIDEISSATTTLAVEHHTLLETIIQFITNLL